MNLKGCFSRESDNWETPKELYNYFMSRGYYDPCPLNSQEDRLKKDWKRYNFVNPPYSKLLDWVNKSIIEMLKGNKVVMLTPARTDTKAFRKLYEFGAKFMFITGRLKFSEKNSAPFPSVLVYLGNYKTSNITFIDSSELKNLEDILAL